MSDADKLKIAAAILAAGMWLGKLQSDVSHLQERTDYFHGPITGAERATQQ